MNNHLKLPFVSVIIPCRNEKKFIEKCLNSIITNDYPPKKIEILVVDGMSDDKTREIIKIFTKKYSFIKLLDNPKKIVPTAMNIGLKSAQGNVIIRIDAHSWITQNFIIKNIECLRKTKADCVGGPIKSLSDTFMGKAISLAMSSLFGVGNARFRYSQKSGYVDTLAFSAYRREVFDKIGLFDEEFIRNQDDELNFRLIKNNGKIFMSPEIKSFYYVRSTLFKLWRQYFQYGYFKVKLIQKNKAFPSLRCLVPAIFICSLIISGILGLFFLFFLWVFFGILGCYLIFILIGSLILSLKNNLKYFSILPVIFIILHFRYGFGFLKGLIDFVIFKKKQIKEIPLSR